MDSCRAVDDAMYVGAGSYPRMPTGDETGRKCSEVEPPPPWRALSIVGAATVVEVETVDVDADAHAQRILDPAPFPYEETDPPPASVAPMSGLPLRGPS